MTIAKTYCRGGKTRTKAVLADTGGKPVSADQLARNISGYSWYLRKVSEGGKGPVVYEYTRRQVIPAAAGLPRKTVRLLIRRTLGGKPQYSSSVVHQPVQG
ncbi:MAG: hypothetical protein DRG59_04065 [Deltaproteobacteria bacterium]|nr:MAG: hypothetical protein DRG59_04065 [Deltaproteobacteria bacterium]